MPHFKVSDDAHSHPKAIMAGDAAWGMWNRAGCWSMAYGTDGFIPEWWVKQQPQGAAKMKRLVAAQLWSPGIYQGERPEYRGQKGYNFHEWRQDTYEKVEADREKWRQKKASQRAMSPGDKQGQDGGLKGGLNGGLNGQNPVRTGDVNEMPETGSTSQNSHMSPGDIWGDSREIPGYIPNTQYPIEGYVSESATEPNGRGISATPGAELVRSVIPDTYPAAVRTELRLQANALLKQGHSRAHVRTTLERWLSKTGVGPRLLPSLLADVIKDETAAAAGHTNGGQVHKMRATANLAAELRQAENQAIAATARKELP